MKITATITSENASDRWTAAFPTIDCDKCFPVVNGRMKAQPDECFRELAASPMIIGVDYRCAYMNQIVASWVRYVNQWKDESSIANSADNISATMKRIGRRAESGHSTHVVAKWSQLKDGSMTLSITLGNDGVVQRREYERFFAWKLAEAAQVVNEDLAERGMKGVIFKDGVAELLEELKQWRKSADIGKLNTSRHSCERNVNGYCTPCKLDCPCYNCGRCVEAKA